jgi:small subunit ribosomal protein S16
MVVRIRLARFGKRNNPFYNIVVAHARTARNSKPLEVLGTYDPVAITPENSRQRPFKDVKLDVSRAKYWIGVGAQPSDSAWKLLNMVCRGSTSEL